MTGARNGICDTANRSFYKLWEKNEETNIEEQRWNTYPTPMI